MKKILILVAVLAASGCSRGPVDQQPRYEGREAAQISGEVARYCDGHSGRMVFVFNDYKKGGLAVLENQQECK